jgi:hypothetical protein
MIRQTSILSFESVLTSLNERHYNVYWGFRNYGIPATDLEVAKSMGYADPNMVRPRRNELVKKGLLRQGEKRHCSISGKLALTWTAV